MSLLEIADSFYAGDIKRIVVNDLQFGDTGKGHIVDYLAKDASVVLRYSGSANAGHTVVTEDNKTLKLHSVPSGIIRAKSFNFIMAPALVPIDSIIEELRMLQNEGIEVTKENFGISESCHVTLEYHIDEEKQKENAAGKDKIGSTLKGVGPTARDKADRSGIRIIDFVNGHTSDRLEKKLLSLNGKIENPKIPLKKEDYLDYYHDAIEFLRPFLVSDDRIFNKYKKDKWLFEGAQGHFLDPDYGTFPYVTSTTTNFPKARFDMMISVMKAYNTRVGNGPFAAKIRQEELEEEIRKKGNEYGATTGRPRDCGWFDAVMARTACSINEPDYLAITKLDVLSDLKSIKIVRAYQRINDVDWQRMPNRIDVLSRAKPLYEEFPGWDEDIGDVKNFNDLPQNAKNYLKAIEEICETPIGLISVGPRRDQIIKVR